MEADYVIIGSGSAGSALAYRLSENGKHRVLVLDVTLNKIAPYPFLHQKETIGVSARGTVTRSDFGMTYAVDGGIVGDEVEVLIEVEALRED